MNGTYLMLANSSDRTALADKYPVPFQLLQEQYLAQLEPLRQRWRLLPRALPALGLLALIHHPELIADLLPELSQDHDDAGHLDELYGQPARSIPVEPDEIVVKSVKVSRYLD